MRIVFLLPFLGLAFSLQGRAVEPFRIEVVDEASGWPVPLVKLTTTHRVSFISDNAGIIAVDLPELMNRETWFFIESDGYGVKPDGFGYEGVRLQVVPGGVAKVQVDRKSLAQRLGRLTGAGIFGESQKLGERSDWEESGVFGCDSIQVARYRGKTFWLWGDTNLARYPLGIFDCSFATTPTRPLQSFTPPIAVELDYFRDEKSLPRGVADLEGKGPTWLSAMVTLSDESGAERLVATYAKIEPPLTTYRRGLCAWNDEIKQFESVRELWNRSGESPKPPPAPDGHPSFWTDEAGIPWVWFGNPFPKLRVEASYEAWIDPSRWIGIDPPGKLKKNSRDGEGEVEPHTGSIDWCEARQKWVTIFVEKFGKPSSLGELWYAESSSPFGPWSPAVKVFSHRHYTFYNPRLRFDLLPEDSQFLLFEGTYTTTFSGNPEKTPRYDYNQVLYRIDFKELDAVLE